MPLSTAASQSRALRYRDAMYPISGTKTQGAHPIRMDALPSLPVLQRGEVSDHAVVGSDTRPGGPNTGTVSVFPFPQRRFVEGVDVSTTR